MRLLGLFAKAPVPGEAKTRLIPELGPERAARVAEAFLRDAAQRFSPVAEARWLCYSPAQPATTAWFEQLADGKWSLWPQPNTPLGERLARFFQDAFARGHRQVIALGADSPTLPIEHLSQAFRELERVDCVVGPATDGGYYLLGLSRPLPSLFEAIDFSTERVLGQTVDRVIQARATLAVLPPWYDVDGPADLTMLAGHLRALATTGQGGEWPHTGQLFPL